MIRLVLRPTLLLAMAVLCLKVAGPMPILAQQAATPALPRVHFVATGGTSPGFAAPSVTRPGTDPARGTAFDQPPAEQGPDRVASEHSPVAGRSGHGYCDRASVGVGIIRDDEIGGCPVRFMYCQVDGAGLLRIGERNRRKFGVGLELIIDADRTREPSPLEDSLEGLTADPVKRGVDDAGLARRVLANEGRDLGHVVV